MVTSLIGERKAIYEDCENEKKENKEKIKQMKEEIKLLQNQLRECSESSEPILKHVQERKNLDLNVLKRKSGDEAVEVREIAGLFKMTMLLDDGLPSGGFAQKVE